MTRNVSEVLNHQTSLLIASLPTRSAAGDHSSSTSAQAGYIIIPIYSLASVDFERGRCLNYYFQ